MHKTGHLSHLIAMTLWLIKKLPILIPILLLLGLCLIGVITLVAQNMSEGFGITENMTDPEGEGEPGDPIVIDPPIYTSGYCTRVGDSGPGNPFSGYPTSAADLQSPGYIGTDFCDPLYPFEWEHEGLDFLYWSGIPIVATADGTIQQAGFDFGLGNVVILCSGGWCARFGHLNSLTVTTGQTVTRGTQIGTAGSTGNYTTGFHLHYDMYNADGFWDPFPTLN